MDPWFNQQSHVLVIAHRLFFGKVCKWLTNFFILFVYFCNFCILFRNSIRKLVNYLYTLPKKVCVCPFPRSAILEGRSKLNYMRTVMWTCSPIRWPSEEHTKIEFPLSMLLFSASVTCAARQAVYTKKSDSISFDGVLFYSAMALQSQ